MKKILLSLVLIFGLCSVVSAADQFDKTLPADDTLIPAFPAFQRTNNEAQDRVFQDYQEGADVFWSSTTEVIVSAGSVVSSNSGGTVRRYRTNTSTTTVGWGNIDTGAEASSTTYYVYAVADTDATTFTIEISTSSSAPTGATYYKKLGSFFNNSSSNIDDYKVYSNAYLPSPTDASGIPKVTAIYSYGTSASSYTLKQSDLKFVFGTITVAGSSSQAITNLPFSGTSTYAVIISKTANSAAEPPAAKKNSGSQFTAYNNHSDATGDNGTFGWTAIGY